MLQPDTAGMSGVDSWNNGHYFAAVV